MAGKITKNELSDALSTEINNNTSSINSVNTQLADITNNKLPLKANQLDLTAALADITKIPPYAVATGSANTYIVTLSPAPTSYVDGMGVILKINVASTGASTLNVNGLGAKPILDSLGNTITSGGLKAGVPYTMRYNGTAFIVLGKGGGGNATASQLLSGYTATVDSGQIVGTILNNGDYVGNPVYISDNSTLPKGYYNSITFKIPILAGDNYVVNSATTTTLTSLLSLTKVREMSFNQTGTYRIVFTLTGAHNSKSSEYSAEDFPAKAQIYVNNIARGTVRNTGGSGTITYTEDISLNAGDLIEIFACTDKIFTQASQGYGTLSGLKVGVDSASFSKTNGTVTVTL